ncbi:hypothetical protein VNI00_004804 [Paramarasmius palmivorus]|uniref:Uncharacterized protein n=1 Tax=Paramarasmius palmivorus TaxID=297713 RepID=A0AAW0DF24_9AGAR
MSTPVAASQVDSPRGRLALFSIYADSVATGRAQGADRVYNAAFNDKQQATPDVVINKFWKNADNKEIVDAFMNNKLCIEAAQGKQEAFDAYKKYAVQDYFYLLDWFKFRVLRLATLPHNDFNLVPLGDELDSVYKSLYDFVIDWYITCLKPVSQKDRGVGLKPEDFQVERTVGEIAYGQFLQNNAREDDWYNLHIILIGCYWAWSKLAVNLYNDANTKRDTIFWNNWIVPNVKVIDDKTAEMADFANALSYENAQTYTSKMSDEQAQELFRTALRLEVGLFNSSYDTPVKRPKTASRLPVGIRELSGSPGQEGQGPQSRGAWKKLLGLRPEGDDGDDKGDVAGKK